MLINLTADRKALEQMILDLAEQNGCAMSKARADKLARKVRHGDFTPELTRLLPFADPTGEEATNRVMQAAA